MLTPSELHGLSASCMCHLLLQERPAGQALSSHCLYCSAEHQMELVHNAPSLLHILQVGASSLLLSELTGWLCCFLYPLIWEYELCCLP